MPATALWKVVTSNNEVPVGVIHSIATEAGVVQYKLWKQLLLGLQ